MQDVSLGGPPAKRAPSKVKKISTGQYGNTSLRKSLNITEEALAIGKVPPEEVAKLLA